MIHKILIAIPYIAIVVSYLPLTSADHYCDLNKEECFLNSSNTRWKDTWTLKYHTNQQDYIEEISKGDSWLMNPWRDSAGLSRIDGQRVGFVQEATFDDGRTIDVITKAMKPLILEIPNFLTDEECEHIKKRATDPNEGGMFNSVAKGGLTPVDDFNKTGKSGRSKGPFGMFIAWDRDLDNKITMDEIATLIHWQKALTFTEDEIREMFAKLNQTSFIEDGVITIEEFENLDTIAIREECELLYRTDARFQQRASKQAWLFMEQWVDPLIHNIRERLVTLTDLPREIVYGGEMLQVVHYEPLGHYHAHMDSETHRRPEIPCCHQFKGSIITTFERCRLCRYITFMMYLNDVEEGGETAFPQAGGPLLTEHQLRGTTKTDKYNLSKGCKLSNVALKPQKGKAVLWYNHHMNQTDGWMGELDPYSLHGGCDVIKGEKWIANMWITAPYGNTKHIPSQYLNWEDLYFAELASQS